MVAKEGLAERAVADKFCGGALQILQKCDIVTTPGSGFGPAGEGFVRASAFAHRWALNSQTLLLSIAIRLNQ